jgi:hypothetical protein
MYDDERCRGARLWLQGTLPRRGGNGDLGGVPGWTRRLFPTPCSPIRGGHEIKHNLLQRLQISGCAPYRLDYRFPLGTTLLGSMTRPQMHSFQDEQTPLQSPNQGSGSACQICHDSVFLETPSSLSRLGTTFSAC